ncbi:MAG: 1-acyl-sn-glycerol-3-phosphate acyltransferase [bacterium]|nr:1-acyl-sn-glycerol-3-phosphate acyltransferase [bacterium]
MKDLWERVYRVLRRYWCLFVAWFLRGLIRCRYDIELRGFEELPPLRGALLLANHPSELDPMVLVCFLWERLQPHPVVLMTFYRQAYARPFLDLCGAIPFADLEAERTVEGVRQLKQALAEVVASLHAGKNILLYPSGRLYRSGREVIGNASGTHLILSRVPEVPVVLIRSRGFWGSSFSCAHGEKPDLRKALLRAGWMLLLNGFIFCPKRKIVIEAQLAPVDFPRHADRRTLNRWLEEWFNAPGEEPRTIVPMIWWQAWLGKRNKATSAISAAAVNR